VRYYVQGFFLAGIGAVVVGSAAAELYAVAVHPVSVVGVATYVALGWLSIGGLAFLLSTVTVYHALVLIALIGVDLLVDRYASGLLASDAVKPAVTIAQYFLPPGHVIAALSGPFTAGLIDEPRLLAWPIAFGVACILVAVLLLRRRPFGS
jgi:hypothetical protein